MTINELLCKSAQPIPEIGMGATVLFHTDRKAATVIAFTKCTVTVQFDKATRTDNNGMSDSQEYTYERDLAGNKLTFWKNARGCYGKPGIGLDLGHRSEYYDFSF